MEIPRWHPLKRILLWVTHLFVGVITWTGRIFVVVVLLIVGVVAVFYWINWINVRDDDNTSTPWIKIQDNPDELSRRVEFSVEATKSLRTHGVKIKIEDLDTYVQFDTSNTGPVYVSYGGSLKVRISGLNFDRKDPISKCEYHLTFELYDKDNVLLGSLVGPKVTESLLSMKDFPIRTWKTPFADISQEMRQRMATIKRKVIFDKCIGNTPWIKIQDNPDELSRRVEFSVEATKSLRTHGVKIKIEDLDTYVQFDTSNTGPVYVSYRELFKARISGLNFDRKDPISKCEYHLTFELYDKDNVLLGKLVGPKETESLLIMADDPRMGEHHEFADISQEMRQRMATIKRKVIFDKCMG